MSGLAMKGDHCGAPLPTLILRVPHMGAVFSTTYRPKRGPGPIGGAFHAPWNEESE